MVLLKHINNTDVAIEIIKSFYVKEKEVYKLHVMWWDIGICHPPRCMGFNQKITIPREVMRNEWRVYEYTERGDGGNSGDET